MPRPLVWTPDRDLQLRRLRADGASWDAIAAALGISRWASSARGRHVGARQSKQEAQPQVDALDAELANPARAPLRAGHPFTWGLLTRGTLLEGADYAGPQLQNSNTPGEMA